jgi:PRTRC genetic system protein F
MFQLPHIDSRIPTALVPRDSRLRGALMARAMLQAGVITERTLPARLDADHLKTCQRALQTWLHDALSSVQFLRPLFRLTLGEPADIGLTTGDGKGLPKPGAEIAWYGTGGVRSVGPALEQLENVRPRLGMTVLRTIEHAAWRTLPLFTPSMALEAASEAYWYGEEDEEMALDESCGADEAARADMRENMLTRQMFDETFPPWALHWRNCDKGLSNWTLRRCAAEMRNRRVVAVIKDVLAIKAIKLPEADGSQREGRFIGFAGLLSWGERDALSLRVVDDYQQMIGESGEYFEECGSRRVAIDSPEGFGAWLNEMDGWCRTVRLLDGLIVKLSEGQWAGSLKEEGCKEKQH